MVGLDSDHLTVRVNGAVKIFDLSFIKRTGPAVVMTIACVKLTVKLVPGNSGFNCQTDCAQVAVVVAVHKIVHKLCT